MPQPLKNTSVCEIIDRLQSNWDWQNQPLRRSDIIDWIGQGIKKMGAPLMLKSRITGIDDGSYPSPILKISNYRTTIPCDCYMISQVACSSSPTGPFVVARSATGNFDIVRGDLNNTSIDPATNTYPPGTGDKIQFVADIFNESYSDAFTRLNSTPDLDNLLDSIFVNKNYGTGVNEFRDNELTYSKNPPYLEFSIRDGYCMIAYKAIGTDKDGYPLVPDEEDVKEALYWYLDMKLTYPMWRNGKVRDIVYKNSQLNWNLYRNKAKGNINMPSADELPSMMNAFNRLVPLMNEHITAYKYVGQQEIRYNS